MTEHDYVIPLGCVRDSEDKLEHPPYNPYLFRRNRALDEGNHGIDDGRLSARHGVKKCAPPTIIRRSYHSSLLSGQRAEKTG